MGRVETQVLGISKIQTQPGVSVCYRYCGHGPLVVLIPSLGRAGEDFDTLAPLLARARLRVLMPEPRGIEGSTPLRATDSLRDMAADIAAIIEAEGAGPAIVIGHAAGNWVARVLAHDRPDLTRAVALLAAIVTNTVPPDLVGSISACQDLSLSEVERLGYLRQVYFAKGADASVWLDGWWPDASVAQRRASRQTTDKTWIRVADTHPTLYVAAAEDVISPPPDLADLREVIGPLATCDVIAGAGHALLPEQPELVAQSLLAWIDGLDDARIS